jgi:hypothetical protein
MAIVTQGYRLWVLGLPVMTLRARMPAFNADRYLSLAVVLLFRLD